MKRWLRWSGRKARKSTCSSAAATSRCLTHTGRWIGVAWKGGCAAWRRVGGRPAVGWRPRSPSCAAAGHTPRQRAADGGAVLATRQHAPPPRMPQAVRNMDDLECMACPPKYRHIATFWKYYSGQVETPYPTIFSERRCRRWLVLVPTLLSGLLLVLAVRCWCQGCCCCCCRRRRHVWMSGPFVPQDPTPPHPTPLLPQSAATTRRPTTCGSCTMGAGRRPASGSWATPGWCALAACASAASAASTRSRTTGR